jgi:signal transduction histidine kinase/ligand-binding sensor domain-containing protein
MFQARHDTDQPYHLSWLFMNRSALSIRLLAALTVAVVACYMAGQAFALDPQKVITQFNHRSWGAADGIDKVYSIAQTRDGYLWIGAINGLFRFDGLRFTRWAPGPGEPNLPYTPGAMLGSKDGSLWLGGVSGVFRLDPGTGRLSPYKGELPLSNVTRICETTDGVIWFAGDKLARFANGKFEVLGPEWGLPRKAFKAIAEDHEGTLWVSILDPSQTPFSDGSFAFLPKGESRFQVSTQQFAAAFQLQAGPVGTVWAAPTRNSVKALRHSGTDVVIVSPAIEFASQDILFDRDGALWITTVNAGLRRLGNPKVLGIKSNDSRPANDRFDKFQRNDGLSSDIVLCIFEDREGSIWIGTSSGVDCFRENKITSFSVREGLPFDQNLVLQCAVDGSIWAGCYPQGFEHLARDGGVFVDRKWLELQARTGPDTARTEVYCMLTTPQGQLLAGTGLGVIMLHTNGTGEFLAMPGGLQLNRVKAMTVDADGGLWLCDYEKGTYRIRGERADHISEILQKVIVAHGDYAGRVWFGHVDGSLGWYESGQYKRYAGPLPGNVRAILSEPDGKVWFAGEGGLSFFNGKYFRALTRTNGLPKDDLFVALKDDLGSYWFAGMDAIFSATPENLEKALGSDGGLVCGEVLAFSDGLRGFIRPAVGYPALAHPLATKGPDGRLWFSTGGGLAMVNPRSIPENKTPPPVHIEKVVAGGKTYPKLNSLELPMGVRSCQIDYLGLSFSNPAKVRYRYKLENYDQDWVEAGPRRQALYSNLKPRKYRFQVVASNDDGVWNETGDSIEFVIPPAFYETAWFPPLCALPIGMAAWGLYRLRLARATARVKQQLEGQIKERKRIAQELHDTLLQGFTGIGLKLDAITAKLPESLGETKQQLQKILDLSDQYLTEARRSVWELRSTSLEKTDDFAKVLSEACGRILEGTGIRLSCSVIGDQRKLPVAIEDNLLRICEEAVTNAVKHARPTEVRVNLDFGSQKVVLRIKDNGCGFDPQGPEATKSGHFGLVGIQERVRALAGSVSLSSQPGKGTEITISVETM